MSTESLRSVRDHFSEVVERVELTHERVAVTRNGRAAAVLISPEDLAQLEDTIDLLSDPQTLADIREANAAYARGEVVRGVHAVRGCVLRNDGAAVCARGPTSTDPPDRDLFCRR